MLRWQYVDFTASCSECTGFMENYSCLLWDYSSPTSLPKHRLQVINTRLTLRLTGHLLHTLHDWFDPRKLIWMHIQYRNMLMRSHSPNLIISFVKLKLAAFHLYKKVVKAALMPRLIPSLSSSLSPPVSLWDTKVSRQLLQDNRSLHYILPEVIHGVNASVWRETSAAWVAIFYSSSTAEYQ